MEGLRSLASRVEAEELRFSIPERREQQFHLIETNGDDFVNDFIPQQDITELLARVSSRSSAASITGEVKLIYILRSDDGALHVAKPDFDQIWTCLGLDEEPYLRYLITRSAYGFYHFESVYDGDISFYYYGYVPYLLIWRYNATTHRTQSIILPRASAGRSHGYNAFTEFSDVLYGTREYIRSPHFLIQVVASHGLEVIEWTVGRQVSELRRLERQTGFGVWVQERSSRGFETSEVIEMSKTLANIQVNVANNMRFLENADVMLDHVLNYHHQLPDPTEMKLSSHSPADDSQPAKRRSLIAAARVLKQQVASGKTTHDYLAARAKSQSTVLFSLLTHEDSAINERIARATQEDGSAMKTIAVMTMAFLPATFFAALFAIPSLQWSQPGHVVQSNFWVYWAFTIPATLLVFLFWVLLRRGLDIYSWIMLRTRVQGRKGNNVESKAMR